MHTPDPDLGAVRRPFCTARSICRTGQLVVNWRVVARRRGGPDGRDTYAVGDCLSGWDRRRSGADGPGTMEYRHRVRICRKNPTGVAGGRCVAGDPLSSHDGSVTRVGVSIKSRWAPTTTPSPAGGSRRCSFRRGRASTEAGRRTCGRARCGFARRGPAATHLPSLEPVCLILGEMGFEPLKPVGEPDAANSRIRFDVRLGGSFAAIVRCTVSEVAKLSRLRVRPGTGSAPGRASRYCGRGRRGPTRWRPSRRRARETDGSRAPA